MNQPGPWNAVAAAYGELFTPRAAPLADAILDSLALTGSERVLDVCCGPGTFTRRAAPRVGQVVAVDFAESMLESLRASLLADGIENVDPVQMDAEALTFDDASFDAAVSMFGWFLLADRASCMAHMHRVAKPGARVVVTCWCGPERNTMMSVGMEALRAELPQLPRPAQPPATQDPANVERELREAGLEDVQLATFNLPMCFASATEYWTMFERSGAPIVVARQRLGEQAWEAARQGVLARLQERFGDGRVELAAEAMIASGRRA